MGNVLSTQRKAHQMLTHQVSKRSFLLSNASGWRFAAHGGVLLPLGRRVMLCLVLMAVELVIASTRVQSANYTAYKPSTGRPQAAAPGRSAAPTPCPRARGPGVGIHLDPTLHPGRRPQCLDARPRARVSGGRHRTHRGPSPGPQAALPRGTRRAHLAWHGQRAALQWGPAPPEPAPNPRWLPRAPSGWLQPCGRIGFRPPLPRSLPHLPGPSHSGPLSLSLALSRAGLPPPSPPGPGSQTTSLQFPAQTLEPALSTPCAPQLRAAE